MNGLALLLASIAELVLGTQGISHSVHRSKIGSRRNNRLWGLLHQPHSTSCSHSLVLPGDFNFIYNQDQNPSSINLGEQQQKKGLKKTTEG